jgi:hypothetical protein
MILIVGIPDCQLVFEMERKQPKEFGIQVNISSIREFESVFIPVSY